jgi:hypothetical protein
MQELGNLITILGIFVTFVAYFGRDSGVKLADLEPGLTRRWLQTRGWVYRRLGLSRDVVVHGSVASMTAIGTVTATGMAWRPIQPDDDIDARVEKLARNLDSLRADITEGRTQDRQQARKVTDDLDRRLTWLERLVEQRHEESRRSETAAMRWEVRGLVIALFGALLSAIGAALS